MGRTVVLGASLKEHRYSNMAIKRLVSRGEEVFAYGLRQGEVAGIPVHTGLVHFENIDTVTLYLNASNQKELYTYILSLKPKRVIFNPGSENPELYRLLEEDGISFENACTLAMLAVGEYQLP